MSENQSHTRTAFTRTGPVLRDPHLPTTDPDLLELDRRVREPHPSIAEAHAAARNAGWVLLGDMLAQDHTLDYHRLRSLPSDGGWSWRRLAGSEAAAALFALSHGGEL